MSTMTLPSNPRLVGLQSAYLPPPPSRPRTISSGARNINDSRNVKLPSNPSSGRRTNQNELRHQKSVGNLSSRQGGIDPSLSSSKRMPPPLPNPPLPARIPANSKPSTASLRTLHNSPLPGRSQGPSHPSSSFKNPPPQARPQLSSLASVTSSEDPNRGRSMVASSSKLKLENSSRSRSLDPSRVKGRPRADSPDHVREFEVSSRQIPPVPSLPSSTTINGSDRIKASASATKATETEMKAKSSSSTTTNEFSNQAGAYYNAASEVVGNAIKKVMAQGTSSSSTTSSNAKVSSTAYDASHLWDSLFTRMTTAATYVKAHLSDDVDPEEKVDPQTGESHLIKVMKAHHLRKVERKEELPEWLFGEEERKGWEVGELEIDLSEGRKDRELRPRGNSESSKASWDSGYFSSSREDSFDSKRGNNYDQDIGIGRERSRAGDKLKMMRERKRGNLVVN